ncbi:MAG: hypothetical protein P857_242 [Candidatus Xenolissoclinum pacificiensis L6]|uniref:Uncharacterized protein n=1 Tax=Candidatus Xenolissoclinum pacificiensis L6 TaxID=1401685 RepID=W2UYY3_9RICK|nr:MAG: hypothetical protein P857_242 [Candidatus Xenolissoclinum pacificiensis L6]
MLTKVPVSKVYYRIFIKTSGNSVKSFYLLKETFTILRDL